MGELFSHIQHQPVSARAYSPFPYIESPGFQHKVYYPSVSEGRQSISIPIVVYGVKEPLIVEFQKKAAGEKAPNVARYRIELL